MKDEYLSFRKNKIKVNYSNSFNFRSRCKVCGSVPCSTVARKPMYYAFTSSRDYRNNTSGPPSDSYLRFEITNRHQFNHASFGVHCLNLSHFRSEKNRFSREESWNRIVSCSCGITWWAYKNTTRKHSPRTVNFRKK